MKCQLKQRYPCDHVILDLPSRSNTQSHIVSFAPLLPFQLSLFTLYFSIYCCNVFNLLYIYFYNNTKLNIIYFISDTLYRFPAYNAGAKLSPRLFYNITYELHANKQVNLWHDTYFWYLKVHIIFLSWLYKRCYFLKFNLIVNPEIYIQLLCSIVIRTKQIIKSNYIVLTFYVYRLCF